MVEKLQRPTLRHLYIVGWLALVTVTLLQSSAHPVVGPPAPPGHPDAARELFLTAGHVVAFSVMTALLWWALRPARHALLVGVVFCVVYGAATELLQTLVRDRGASLDDFAVDCLVSGITALAIYWRASIPSHRLTPSRGASRRLS
ncbi:MAG: VanZ family protein [Anaerolineae bacterium]